MSDEPEIRVRFDQTLTQDATGTLVMLALESLGLERVQTEVSAQYVDHNILQGDHRNPDDHRFLLSACKKYGVYYSGPENGVSHPLHMMHFGKPGAALIGSDSHTSAAGSLGMFAVGMGGIDVAMAMAGLPVSLSKPKIWGIKLTGELPDRVSAKDVILELLRRHDVKGGIGYVLEYFGPGLANLSTMDRHVIANMGTELGATTSVFPSDDRTQAFLKRVGREDDWIALAADEDAEYDRQEQIDLGQLEPLIAKPSSPGNVVPVLEVAGAPISQSYIGSSANPGFRDFTIAAEILRGKSKSPNVSLDLNPTSRHLLLSLIRSGHFETLLNAGARFHQPGCNGCIGMGQAPASDTISLRTVPRNFPDRSGTHDDNVYLCSPETAAASAYTGVITDPRKLELSSLGEVGHDETELQFEKAELVEPLTSEERRSITLTKGPNIRSLPTFETLSDNVSLRIILKLNDNISTDEILAGGVQILPFRSNIEKISEFSFRQIDPDYAKKAKEISESSNNDGHAIVAGENYGQGSSREHAALAPRTLGLRLVLAKSFARIHRQNLINYGVVPLLFENASDFEKLMVGQELYLDRLLSQLMENHKVNLEIKGNNDQRGTILLRHDLSGEEINVLCCGSRLNWAKEQLCKAA